MDNHEVIKQKSTNYLDWLWEVFEEIDTIPWFDEKNIGSPLHLPAPKIKSPAPENSTRSLPESPSPVYTK